jgi:Na+/H+-dicarboxylate symporter
VSLNEAGAATGQLARVTLGYFFGTTVIAVVLGLFLVNVIQPGTGVAPLDPSAPAVAPGEASEDETTVLTTLAGVLMKIFPDNVVEACVEMNILGVLTFSILFGVALAQAGEEGRPVVQGITAFNAVVMRMVLMILWAAPVSSSPASGRSLCAAYQRCHPSLPCSPSSVSLTRLGARQVGIACLIAGQVAEVAGILSVLRWPAL